MCLCVYVLLSSVQKEVSTDSKEAKEYLKSTQPHAQSASAGEEASSMQTTAPSLEEGSRFQPKAATVQGRVPARWEEEWEEEWGKEISNGFFPL